MVKPLGAACNLDCTYCYYLSKAGLPGHVGAKPMPGEILEKYVRDYIEGNETGDICFEWQGGEPALLGLDFFREALALQRRHAPRGRRILNNLQTNGTLLDEEWCRFLKENEFLVGLSVDGPRRLHDAHRTFRGGQPTFERVFTAAKLLKKHKVPFNTLTVVSRTNVKHPLDVYRFLTREMGARMLQFIPCIEPRGFEGEAKGRWDPGGMPVVGTPAARPGSPESRVTEWSVDPEEFGAFLCRVFDDWHDRDVGKHFVNLFENWVAAWSGLPAQICVFHDVCGKAVVVEKDGSVFSCDHFVYPEYRLGGLRDASLVDLVFSEFQVAFGHAKKDTLPEYCRACPWLFACHGECPKNRFVKTPSGEPGLNYLCPAFQRFFPHADERLKRIAACETTDVVHVAVGKNH